MANTSAELELNLTSAGESRYALRFRFWQAGSAVETGLGPAAPVEVSLDRAALQAAGGDPAAYGQCLANELFRSPLALSAFAEARAAAAARSARLRLRLVIDESAADLQNLYWETLADLASQAPLFTSEKLLFSRLVRSASLQPFAPPERSQLKALVVIADPSNLAAELARIDVAEELAQAQAGLAGMQVSVLASGGQATLENMIDRLRDGVDILYIVAHGGFTSKGQAYLRLEKPDGTLRGVTVDELAARFNGLTQLPLLTLLVSCESAGKPAEAQGASPMLALGPRLAASGVPAVVAMQGPVSFETMHVFIPTFFRELNHDGLIDRAMAAARGAVSDRPDWWMPVLFSRLVDNTLFQPTAAGPGLPGIPIGIPSMGMPAAPASAGAARSARIFVSYKDRYDPDDGLAGYLSSYLTQRGHKVFIDKSIRAGEAWLEQIDQQIRDSDFLVVLLSEMSANSQMVQSEVSRAYDYAKLQGRPQILPVRVKYESLLPYALAAYLSPVQYVVWNGPEDSFRVAEEIAAAVQGRMPDKAPIQLRSGSGPIVLSEDGSRIRDTDELQPPLPEFDPRFLEELEEPGGAVKLKDKLYIEREADQRLRREIVKPGTTTTIRAARQTGKSSLLVRGLALASQKQIKPVLIDLQKVDDDFLKDSEIFLRYLAEFILSKLRLDVRKVADFWGGSLGAQDKLTALIEDYVLEECQAQILLALDEVDKLLHVAGQQTLANDFFGLIRSWHNLRAYNEKWDNLNVVQVISTEPYLLIQDVNQSPFNVGLRLYLKDFDEAQVRDLNQRHGGPVSDKDFAGFMRLFAGQPYLVRKALYMMVAERMTWERLYAVAREDGGPFGDHLRHYSWLLKDEPDLRNGLKSIVRGERITDETIVFRLLRAGLIEATGEVVRCRCELYQLYFKDKL